jgi:hypothetical protein
MALSASGFKERPSKKPSLNEGDRESGLFFDPEDGSEMFFRNFT